MSLLSDRRWLKRRAIQRCAAKMGFLHGQRAMQAGLKCDRVPQKRPDSRSVSTHVKAGLAEKCLSLQQDD
jgi:hypothetical protein